MYVKFFSSTIATIVAVIIAISLLRKSRGQVLDKIAIRYFVIAASLGAVMMFAISLASYLYIYYPSIFLTETTLLIYRVHFVMVPLVTLFLWLIINQFFKHGKLVNGLVIGAFLIDTAINAVSPLAQVEVDGILSVDLYLIPSMILGVLLFGFFGYVTIIFLYYAIKQSGSRRIQSALLGFGGLFGIMLSVSNAVAYLTRNSILIASVWIFGALMLLFLYIGILPPRRLLRKKSTKASSSKS
nr:hypothetical protein [Candidatus Freyarchaeota archaeon]